MFAGLVWFRRGSDRIGQTVLAELCVDLNEFVAIQWVVDDRQTGRDRTRFRRGFLQQKCNSIVVGLSAELDVIFRLDDDPGFVI